MASFTPVHLFASNSFNTSGSANQGTVSELKERKTIFDRNEYEDSVKSDRIQTSLDATKAVVNKGVADLDREVEQLAGALYSNTREMREDEKANARGMALMGKFEAAAAVKMAEIDTNLKNNAALINAVRNDLIQLTQAEKANQIQDIVTRSAQIIENIALAAGIDLAAIPILNLFSGAGTSVATAAAVVTDSVSLGFSIKNVMKLNGIISDELSWHDVIPHLAKLFLNETAVEDVSHFLDKFKDEKVAKIAIIRHRKMGKEDVRRAAIYVRTDALNGTNPVLSRNAFIDYGTFYIVLADENHHLTVTVTLNASASSLRTTLVPYTQPTKLELHDVDPQLPFPEAVHTRIPIDILADLEKVYERMSVLGAYMETLSVIPVKEVHEQIFNILTNVADTGIGLLAELDDTQEKAIARKTLLANLGLSILERDTNKLDQHPLQNSISREFTEKGQHTEVINPPYGTEDPWILKVMVKEVFASPASLGIGKTLNQVMGIGSYIMRIHHGPVTLTAENVRLLVISHPENGVGVHSHPEAVHAKAKTGFFDGAKRFLSSDIGKALTEVVTTQGKKWVNERLANAGGPQVPTNTNHKSGFMTLLDTAGSVIRDVQVRHPE
jgi:hypothetical protein